MIKRKKSFHLHSANPSAAQNKERQPRNYMQAVAVQNDEEVRTIKTTTTTTTTPVPCADYTDPNSPFYVEWKKSGFSNPRRVGDNSISFQVSVPQKAYGVTQADFSPFSSDYVGFLIFSRTECSQKLVKELGSGENVRFGVMQKDAAGTEVYRDFYSYLRWEGDSARRSTTLQFSLD